MFPGNLPGSRWVKVQQTSDTIIAMAAVKSTAELRQQQRQYSGSPADMSKACMQHEGALQALGVEFGLSSSAGMDIKHSYASQGLS